MTWRHCRLGDVITLKRGHDLPEHSRQDGVIPVVSSSGVTGYHNEAKASPPGVVTGRYGTLGEVYYIEEDYWPLNTALYVIDFKGNDSRFAAYFLKNALRGYRSDKAAVPGIDRNALHELMVKIPGHNEQVAIASTLSVYDDFIANNRRRIDLLEKSSQLLFNEWFVHLRYPGHEHNKVVNGVPEGWERSRVDSVCREFSDGDWLESKDQGGDDLRILQISNIGLNAFVETGNYRYITEDTLRRLNCNEVVCGDILISRMPEPIGRAWLVTKQPWRMVTAVDVTIARPDSNKMDPLYFLHHLNSPPHIGNCKAGATGATRPRVAKRVMGALPILLPPRDLQDEFAAIAFDANELKARLFQHSGRLTQARDLLLPRLMDGRLSV
jgi:type I restriction enzyme S subunit